MRYPDFAKRFKVACESANMPKSQNALGKKLGVSGTMVHNYRNGLKLPSSDTLSRIAEKLDVSIDWLLNGIKTKEISDDEHRLLNHYRQSNEKGKEYISTVALRESMYTTTNKAISEKNLSIQEIEKPYDISELLMDALEKLKLSNPEKTPEYQEAQKHLKESTINQALINPTKTQKQENK